MYAHPRFPCKIIQTNTVGFQAEVTNIVKEEQEIRRCPRAVPLFPNLHLWAVTHQEACGFLLDRHLEFLPLRPRCLSTLPVEGHSLMNQMKLVLQQRNLVV